MHPLFLQFVEFLFCCFHILWQNTVPVSRLHWLTVASVSYTSSHENKYKPGIVQNITKVCIIGQNITKVCIIGQNITKVDLIGQNTGRPEKNCIIRNSDTQIPIIKK